MLTQNISFKNFLIHKKKLVVKKNLNLILNEETQVISSLSKSYKDSFNKKNTKHFNKKLDYRIIGMGGSTLGAQAIYDFLKKKIKKKFIFVDNLNTSKNNQTKKNLNNLIISKSGNTTETIVNANILIKKKDRNLFITEKKKSYLSLLAQKLKAEVVDHNNYIGGRYSVLSEVGMLPAYFMNLNINKLRKNLLKNLDIKKRKYFTQIVPLISNIYSKKQLNTIVLLNYCPELNEFLFWYQQLLAESLGKKQKGLIPIISTAPKDNHSLLQLYLDGPKDKIFYIFNGTSNNKLRIKKNYFKNSFDFINNKEIKKILDAKKESFIKALKDKDISYREFNINNLDEETIGEMFAYFMIETILIAKSIGVDPFNQPAVEKVKILTKKYLY